MSPDKELQDALDQLRHYAESKGSNVNERMPRFTPSVIKDILRYIESLSDGVSIKGKPEVRLFDARVVTCFADTKSARKSRQGMLEEPDIGENLVVDAGLLQIGNLWLGLSAATATHCGVGSGTTDPGALQVDLVTPIERVSITEKFQVANASHADTFFDTTQGNGTINESGLFNASSGGTMFCRRKLSSAKTKDNTKTMTVAWSVTLTAT
jgi:hypothetical protein